MAKNSSAPLFRARLALRVTTAKRLLTEEHNAKIENPCVGGSIPPRATKNIPTKRQPMQVGVFVSLVRSPRIRSMSGMAMIRRHGDDPTLCDLPHLKASHRRPSRHGEDRQRTSLPPGFFRGGSGPCCPYHQLAREPPLAYLYGPNFMLYGNVH